MTDEEKKKLINNITIAFQGLGDEASESVERLKKEIPELTEGNPSKNRTPLDDAERKAQEEKHILDTYIGNPYEYEDEHMKEHPEWQKARSVSLEAESALEVLRKEHLLLEAEIQEKQKAFGEYVKSYDPIAANSDIQGPVKEYTDKIQEEKKNLSTAEKELDEQRQHLKDKRAELDELEAVCIRKGIDIIPGYHDNTYADLMDEYLPLMDRVERYQTSVEFYENEVKRYEEEGNDKEAHKAGQELAYYKESLEKDQREIEAKETEINEKLKDYDPDYISFLRCKYERDDTISNIGELEHYITDHTITRDHLESERKDYIEHHPTKEMTEMQNEIDKLTEDKNQKAKDIRSAESKLSEVRSQESIMVRNYLTELRKPFETSLEDIENFRKVDAALSAPKPDVSVKNVVYAAYYVKTAYEAYDSHSLVGKFFSFLHFTSAYKDYKAYTEVRDSFTRITGDKVAPETLDAYIRDGDEESFENVLKETTMKAEANAPKRKAPKPQKVMVIDDAEKKEVNEFSDKKTEAAVPEDSINK